MPRKKLDTKLAAVPTTSLKKKLVIDDSSDDDDLSNISGSFDGSDVSDVSDGSDLDDNDNDNQSGGSDIDKADFESDIEDNSSESDNEDNVVCAAKYADNDENDEDVDSMLNDQDLDDIDSKLLEELDIKIKTNDKIIPKDKRITKPFMSKYERVRLICDRARQLADGAKPLVKDVDGLSSRKIASLELENNIIPLIVHRLLPNGYIEIWKVSELAH